MANSLAPSRFPTNGYSSTDNFGDEYSLLPTEFRPSPPTNRHRYDSSPESFSSSQESLPSPPTSQFTSGFGSATVLPSNENNNSAVIIWYLEHPRIFYPFSLCLPRPPTPQALTTYNIALGLTHPVFSVPGDPFARPNTDSQTIVVSCKALQATSLGIYFGPDSKLNFSLFVGNAPPHNRSHLAAEVFAIHKALKISRNVANVFGPERIAIMRIIVVTSCVLAFKVMTKWIEELNKSEWDDADKWFEGAAESKPAFERLERLVVEMVDEDGLEVAFWLVGDEGVAEAEKLAQEKVAGAK